MRVELMRQVWDNCDTCDSWVRLPYETSIYTLPMRKRWEMCEPCYIGEAV